MFEMGSNKIKRCFYVGASFSKCPENFCFKVADFSLVVLKKIYLRRAKKRIVSTKT